MPVPHSFCPDSSRGSMWPLPAKIVRAPMQPIRRRATRESESRRGWRLLLDAYKKDDGDRLILDAEGLLWQLSSAGLGLSFLSERRVILPTQFLD